MEIVNVDNLYIELVEKILKEGFKYWDESRDLERIQIPHYTMEFDNEMPMSREEFIPILTTKEVGWKVLVAELIWFLRGDSTLDYLHRNEVKIWDGDAEVYRRRMGRLGKPLPEGYVGKLYGAQWRSFGESGVDQLVNLINGFMKHPYGTRHLVTAWNPEDLAGNMALPACHWAFELLPTPEGFYLKWHQRSVDVFIGLPFNISSYGLLGQIISLITGRPFLGLKADLSNVHIYEKHMKKVEMQRRRDPFRYDPPRLYIEPEIASSFRKLGESGAVDGKAFDELIRKLKPVHFKLKGYNSYEKLKAFLYTPKF